MPERKLRNDHPTCFSRKADQLASGALVAILRFAGEILSIQWHGDRLVASAQTCGEMHTMGCRSLLP
jgi:hypothetical protein